MPYCLIVEFEFVTDRSIPGVYCIPNSKQLYLHGDLCIGHLISNNS